MTEERPVTANLPSARARSHQYVEFDGQQIEIITDVPEVFRQVAETHAHMLVPAVTVRAGMLELLETRTGYLFNGVESKHYPREELGYLLDLLRDEVRRQFIRARPDILWLHAAAVERDGSAVLIAGPSGVGKSTLSTLLCERGWRLMSDDIAPIAADERRVHPFAEEPRRRRYPGRSVDSSSINSLIRDRVVVNKISIHAEPAVMRAVVHVKFKDASGAELVRLSSGAAALELVRNAINFGSQKAETVSRAADIARNVPAFEMLYGSASEAVELLDLHVFE